MSTPKHNLPSPSYIPTKEFITEQQVSACLSVLRELHGYVQGPAMNFFGEAPPERPELDGGVKSSVAVAIISVCDRLEKIMGDESRWRVEETLSVFKEMTATQKAQQAFLHEQTAAAHSVQLPHYQLRPELMSDGELFFAVWGNKNLPGGRIVGRGKTPAEALADFDDAFDRTPSDQLNLILDQTQPPSDDKPKPE